MAMGRQPEQTQGDFWIATERLAPAPAHPFYQQLNAPQAFIPCGWIRAWFTPARTSAMRMRT